MLGVCFMLTVSLWDSITVLLGQKWRWKHLAIYSISPHPRLSIVGFESKSLIKHFFRGSCCSLMGRILTGWRREIAVRIMRGSKEGRVEQGCGVVVLGDGDVGMKFPATSLLARCFLVAGSQPFTIHCQDLSPTSKYLYSNFTDRKPEW
jgi:hypothetical protein